MREINTLAVAGLTRPRQCKIKTHSLYRIPGSLGWKIPPGSLSPTCDPPQPCHQPRALSATSRCSLDTCMDGTPNLPGQFQRLTTLSRNKFFQKFTQAQYRPTREIYRCFKFLKYTFMSLWMLNSCSKRDRSIFMCYRTQCFALLPV